MSTAFLTGPCSKCEREVLTVRDLQEGELVDCCIHCEMLLSRENLRWADPSEVAALGYFIDGYREKSSEGERGCRGGSCGVQQRQ